MRVNKSRIEKKAQLIELLEKGTGLDLVKNQWDLRFTNTFDVKLKDIHDIKKVVGEFDPTFGKDLCVDFEETGEIWVTCFVTSGLYSGWKFRYRHLLTEDDDCQVEETRNPIKTYGGDTVVTLVCKTD